MSDKTNNKAGHPSDYMSVGEHIDELRQHIFFSVAALFVLSIVLFINKGIVIDLLVWPAKPDFPTNKFFAWLADITHNDWLRINSTEIDVINTKLAGQFSLHIKSSLFGALVLAFPVLMWRLWLFVKPALDSHVIQKCGYVVLEVSLWFFAGVTFGYFGIVPLALNFLGTYVVTDMIANMIDISSILSSVMSIVLASALIFQLPVLIRIMSSLGIIHASTMRKYRRIAIAILIILAAIITPPDVFSQILIFIPMYALYEYGILIAARNERRRVVISDDSSIDQETDEEEYEDKEEYEEYDFQTDYSEEEYDEEYIDENQDESYTEEEEEDDGKDEYYYYDTHHEQE